MLSHDYLPNVLDYPLPDDVLAYLVLLGINITGWLTEDSSRVKRAINGVNIAWAELCMRQLIEESLNLLVTSGELHLVRGPSVILLVLLLLLDLPLDQVLHRREFSLICWFLNSDRGRFLREIQIL